VSIKWTSIRYRAHWLFANAKPGKEIDQKSLTALTPKPILYCFCFPPPCFVAFYVNVNKRLHTARFYHKTLNFKTGRMWLIFFSFTAQIVCAILYLQSVRVWACVEQINSGPIYSVPSPQGCSAWPGWYAATHHRSLVCRSPGLGWYSFSFFLLFFSQRDCGLYFFH